MCCIYFELHSCWWGEGLFGTIVRRVISILDVSVMDQSSSLHKLASSHRMALSMVSDEWKFSARAYVSSPRGRSGNPQKSANRVASGYLDNAIVRNKLAILTLLWTFKCFIDNSCSNASFWCQNSLVCHPLWKACVVKIAGFIACCSFTLFIPPRSHSTSLQQNDYHVGHVSPWIPFHYSKAQLPKWDLPTALTHIDCLLGGYGDWSHPAPHLSFISLALSLFFILFLIPIFLHER